MTQCRSRCGTDPLVSAGENATSSASASAPRDSPTDAIAARLGYSHASHAHRRFSIMMASIPAEDVAEARKLEVERLDAALAAIWDKIVAGNLWAIDRLLKISEQRCKLLGLNAPDRQVVITQEMVEAEIHRLEEEMRTRAVITGVPVPELEAAEDDAGAS